jgi:hypothetical protein
MVDAALPVAPRLSLAPGTIAHKQHETGTNRRCGDSPGFVGEEQGVWRAPKAPTGAMVSDALMLREDAGGQ